ncbi:MFS sugar transporter, putative [Talaromyces stipitatus ATCC 10500]|uniref:MFS sugar transporter, putative n=1 Tax=Talaromyces stipitatus (strain ATCC 10500 / CBS 375.48 / QM 6759 / NRRL 1006) TaxID=441959 RepID=B8LT15_TALSN|nr:MFS sugar transporter, putative [Talaromyces stipitatus ATCC 10500]EED23523.1 MFS sugar transporter, putative [Talaromyces stipitatus ATCC 10500]
MISRRLPPKYVLASILCSFGGVLFGMDTGVIGPVTIMHSYIASFGFVSSTVHGLIVSSILIPAAISSFFAGKVADILGRPKGISLGAFIFGLGAALEAGAAHLSMFIVGRCIEGIGEGLYLGTLVVYICEISPPSKRGPLTSTPQLLITLGLCVGFFVCYGSATVNSSLSWRLPFAILSALALSFSLASLWLPPSPRWLSLRGRTAEAIATWDILGVSHAEREKIEIAEGILEIANPEEASHPQTSQGTNLEERRKNSIWELFSHDVRARTLLAAFMMGMQQLSGIDGVLYYAPLLFQQAGLTSSEASLLASGVSAVAIFSVTIPALIWADGWGRRHSTIYGGIGLGIIMFLIGSLYASNTVHGTYGAGRWLVIVSIYLFAMLYSLSWGVGIKIYAAEIQPQRTRAAATSLAHGSNWIANFLVALTTPMLLASSTFGAYFLFGGCSVLTAVVCAVFMPETRGRSLEEIEEAFKRTSASKRLARAVQKFSGRAEV